MLLRCESLERPCLSRVRKRYCRVLGTCPSYPQKQTSQKRESMCAKGHKETNALPQKGSVCVLSSSGQVGGSLDNCHSFR